MKKLIDDSPSKTTGIPSDSWRRIVLENAQDAVVGVDSTDKVIDWNKQAEVTFGWSKDEVMGRKMADLIIPADYRSRHARGIKHFLESGEGPILNRRIQVPAQHRDGHTFLVELTVTPILVEGQYLFYSFIRNIQEQKNIEEQKESLQRRVVFLSESTKTLLDDPLGYESRLQKLAATIVPALADWCEIELLDADGTLRQVAVSHKDAAKLELAKDLRRRFPPKSDALAGPTHVVRTGKSELASEIPEHLLGALSQDEDHFRLITDLGLKSYMCVPLKTRGRILGVLTLLSAESGKRFKNEDLDLVEELASRAASAIDNALLHLDAELERQKFETIFAESPAIMALMRGPTFIFEKTNAAYQQLVGHRDVLGKTFLEALPELKDTPFCDILKRVYETGTPFHTKETKTFLQKMRGGPLEEVYLDFTYQRVTGAGGKPYGILGTAIDVTDQVRARQQVEHSKHAIENERENFRNLFKQTPEMVCILKGPDHVFEFVNEAHIRVVGFDATGKAVREAQSESVEVHGILDEVYRTGKTAELHEIPVTVAGRIRYFNLTYAARKDGSGQINGIMILGVEVTDQVLARESLRESESRLKFALASANMGAWTFSLKSYAVTLSEESRRLLGLSDESYDLDQAVTALIHPADQDRAKKDLEEAVAARKLYQSEYRIIRLNDGNERWVFSTGRAHYDREGNPDFLSGIVMDITERKRSEEALEAREAEFRALANSIPQLAWIADKEGWIYWYNQRWYDYTGTTLEEMQGWGWEKVHHPDHRGRVVNFVKEAWKKPEAFELTFPLRSKTGEWRWFLTRAVPLLDSNGNITRWFGTNTDVQAEKEIQAALIKAKEEAQSSLKKLDAVVHNLSEGLVFTDPQGNLLSMNPEALRIHEFRNREEMLGRLHDYPDLFALRASDGRELPLEDWPLSRVIRGERFSQYEVEVHRKDTGKTWVGSYGGTPVIDEHGKFILAVLTIRDVTEKKNIENALKEAIRARDEFLSIASHELKTPLTSLTLQSQIRKRQLTNGQLSSFSPEVLTKLFESDLKQLARINRLIDDMLDVARIRTGRLELHKERLNLCSLTHEVIERFRPQLSQSGIELAFNACTTLFVDADSFRLEQVITNLLTNSIKYGQKKPIAVAVKVTPDGRASFQVADHGIGIKQSDLARIFSRFERAISANEISGLGLGLAIARDIVEAHGGEIRVESTLGEGSVFTVELPLSQDQEDR